MGDAIAFLGGGRNEPVSVYLGRNGQASKIGTRETDSILMSFSESDLSSASLESVNYLGHMLLMVHLPDRTLVYDLAASQAVEQPVWFVLTSSTEGFTGYRGRNFIWAYDKWICGDTQEAKIGYLDRSTAKHWGE